jgi:hypothetical protein
VGRKGWRLCFIKNIISAKSKEAKSRCFLQNLLRKTAARKGCHTNENDGDDGGGDDDDEAYEITMLSVCL